jgi:hypothetical protein
MKDALFQEPDNTHEVIHNHGFARVQTDRLVEVKIAGDGLDLKERDKIRRKYINSEAVQSNLHKGRRARRYGHGSAEGSADVSGKNDGPPIPSGRQYNPYG